jgi:EpsI family protein
MTGRRALALAAFPAAIFMLGLVGRGMLQPSESRALTRPLEDLPQRFGEFAAVGDHEMSEGEELMLRADDYIIRTYASPEGQEFGLYVAYYGRQARGTSIHSPRNCLPGAGWEPVQHSRVVLTGAAVSGTVNRYIVEHTSGRRALVYYWYEGRGRREANEYLVKWQMLRDGVFKRRSDEALVRLIFPLPEGWTEADSPGVDEVLVDVADALGDHVPA